MKKLSEQIRIFFVQLRPRWLVILADTSVVPLAWMGAYWLRYNLSTIPEEFLSKAVLLLPVVVVVQLVTSSLFGVHRGVWRFISLSDLVRLVKAVVIGAALSAAVIFLLTRLEQVPRSVFLLYAMLLLTGLAAPRLAYRLTKDHRLVSEQARRVLIIGAGSAGDLLVRDLLRAEPRLYDPIAFVDDDKAKQEKEVHGVRVAGGSESIVPIVQQYGIELIVIAMPTATKDQLRGIVEECEKTKVEFRILPKMHDLISGQVGIRSLREVKIDDLLGREQVSLDWKKITEGLKAKTVLVTGAGGSIGSELCRQLASLNPAKIVLLEQSEFNLYNTDWEIRQNYPDLNFSLCLGDVCDVETVNKVFREYKPDLVFHAAAYKHVPLLENQVREAVKNNILGTKLVADKAVEHKAETFVLISTDKAVDPENVMGATKRISELYCQAISKTIKTKIVTVRFGNVLGSAGSVVPLFQKQIESGGPVTITHPDVSRYFMTISEACQLILQSSVLGKGGEIFVLDMGKPIKIDYLARQMIRLSGKEPGQDIDIVYTGLRDGEKMSEELFNKNESLSDTVHQKIFLAKSENPDGGKLIQGIEKIINGVQKNDERMIMLQIQQILPEFPSGSVQSRARARA